ncbi:hypothetical protein [Bhargavaea ginsengi]|uniref:hypothetical protein n=1 Tax=Bhargavaea ginsengi TaxID=426757 RepID=UPI003C76D63D
MKSTRNLIATLIFISVLTLLMIYQVIVREHWSLKIPPIFIAVFGLAAIVNIIMILYREKKQQS